MKAKKKCLVLIIPFIFAAAAGYFFQFTSWGYLMTVACRPAFTEIADRVYVNRDNAGDPQEILAVVGEAVERDRAFFGELRFQEETVIIICDDDNLIRKLGEDHATVTIAFPQKRHYICVSDEYLETDILAHEITHAETHTRLSAKAFRRIPTWFDEGLATQNDYRERYSEDQWAAQTDNGKNAVALEDMDTPAEFYAGDAEDRRFRYLNAKHEIASWMAAHGRQGLLELFDQLNAGADFHAAYGR